MLLYNFRKTNIDSGAAKASQLSHLTTCFTCHISSYILYVLYAILQLYVFRQMHLELCRISKTLCTSFGIQIASEIAISTMVVSGFLYNIYGRFIQQLDYFGNSIMDQLLVVITLTIAHVLKVIIINGVCKKATNEVSCPARSFLITDSGEFFN